MISNIQSANDISLHNHESILSLIPLKLISSIHSNHIENNRSGNQILSKGKLPNYFHENSLKSIHNIYKKFSNKNLINTYLPIANIQQDIPTVPKQTDTFLHRLVNKFFSITNIKNQKSSHNKRRQQQQRSIKKLKSIKHCHICRKHRNHLSILPSDSLEYPIQSSMIYNTNANTTVEKTSKSFLSLSKFRNLNSLQKQSILSAIELIFDTLISNYH